MSLYHYTDAYALKSIIENQALWLSHVRFMNDNNELFWALDQIVVELEKQEYIESYAQHFKESHKLSHSAALKEALSDYELRLNNPLTSKMTENTGFRHEANRFKKSVEMFVGSFCQTGDLLSQWRGYTLGKVGYCIEFDEKILRANTKNFSVGKSSSKTAILSCLYDDKEKRRIIENQAAQIIKTGYQTFYDHVEGEDLDLDGFECLQGSLETGTTKMVSYEKVYMMLNSIAMDLAKMKNASFKEEAEKRLIINLDSLGDKQHIKYRDYNGVIAPFIEFPFCRSAIKSIKVGPHHNSETAKFGLEKFLDFHYQGDRPDVFISETPLRTG